MCTCIHTCSNTCTNAHSCMCVGRYTPAYHDSTTSMVNVTYPNSTKCGSAPCAWDNVTPTHHTPTKCGIAVSLDSSVSHKQPTPSSTSAHVVSTLSTNCHPANVLHVACVSAQGNAMSANLPPGWPGQLPAGL